jgi:ABC-type multidrug transport system ATPase subunit
MGMLKFRLWCVRRTGSNGAGKSSLMPTVATLQAPTRERSPPGRDVLAEKNEVRKILGYLPQEFGVYPKLSALE